jgi:hypothetical protein
MEPRAIDRFRHRVSLGELVSHPLRAVSSRVRFWRDAGDSFEDAMEVIATHAGGLRQLIEAWHLLRFLFLNGATGCRHRRSLPRGEGRLMRPAALAGPETCLFGLGARRMETDMLAACQARRAGRPAIDAGRPHRIIKRPVRGAVAPYYRLPAYIVAGEHRREPIGFRR